MWSAFDVEGVGIEEVKNHAGRMITAPGMEL